MVGRDRTIETLIERLNRLPGVGPKTAERLAFHLLRVEEQEALELAKAIHDVREAVKSCSVCFQLDASDSCSVCSDETRERDMLLIVEDPREVARFEEVGYRGVYHVLQGRLSQLEGIKLEDLTIRALIQRVEDGEFREICLATNPDLEGEGTAQVLADKLQATGAALTRLARGLPAGSSIAQVSSSILSDAIEGRRPLS